MEVLVGEEKRKVVVDEKTTLTDQKAVLLSTRNLIAHLIDKNSFLFTRGTATQRIKVINLEGRLERCQNMATEIADNLPWCALGYIQDLIIRVQLIQWDIQKLEGANTK